MTQNRSCPICSEPAVAGSETVVSPFDTQTMSFDDFKPHWNAILKKRAFFPYHRCARCGLLYCPSFFSELELNELYGHMPDNTLGQPVEAMRKTQRGYFDVLKRFSPLRGDYLEVGPDMGFFIECCLDRGAFETFWLFEPKRGVQPTLERLLADKPHHVFTTMLTPESIPQGKVSTVVMVHVLDHLIDPKAVLETLKPKLAPGAVLAFVTHDESSFLARVMKAKWGGYSLEHPQLFNPRTLAALLASTGYQVEAIEKTYNHFPLMYLAKQFLFLLGLNKIQLPKLYRMVIGLRLGNLIAIARNPI